MKKFSKGPRKIEFALICRSTYLKANESSNEYSKQPKLHRNPKEITVERLF
jgi:hypothetical protein